MKMEDLKEIKQEIATQDNRCTDQPLFLVMEKKEYPTSSDYSYTRSVWVDEDGEIGYTIEEVREHLKNYNEDDSDNIDKMSDWELQDVYKVREVFMFEVNMFVQAFFTAKSAQEYIEANKHNLNKPFTYAGNTYRNYEMQSVRNHLINLVVPDFKSGCEYCGNPVCSEIADGIKVCAHCEEVYEKHLKISTGD